MRNLRNLRTWLAHENYGGALAAVLGKEGEPTRPLERAMLKSLAIAAGALPSMVAAAGDQPDDEPRKSYDMIGAVAVVPLLGPMFKAGWVERYGGASTERFRARMLAAAQDPDAEAIFTIIDSGGGEVAGTDEAAAATAIAAANKPVHVHADDLMASAAYWVGSQGTRITANPTTDVGSIGVVASLLDISAALEQLGLELHVVSTGPRKGLLAKPEVTEETIAYVQELIDPVFEEFKQAVKRGRNLGIADVRKSADGSVWLAKEALARGLIDAVERRDEAFAAVFTAAEKARQAKRAAVRRRASVALDRRRALRSRLEQAKAAAGFPAETADTESSMTDTPNAPRIRAEKAAERINVAFINANPELAKTGLRCPRAAIAEALLRDGAEAVPEIERLLRGNNPSHFQLKMPEFAPILADHGFGADESPEPAPAEAPEPNDPPADDDEPAGDEPDGSEEEAGGEEAPEEDGEGEPVPA